MSFEPSGGYPPLMRKSESNFDEEALSTRAFSTMNVVNIADIMNKKKNVPFFTTNTEDGYSTDSIFYQKPNEYSEIKSFN